MATMLELPILGLLKEQPMHGYELKKCLDETLGAVSSVSYGSLYPALNRLERAGAIEAEDPAEGTGAATASFPVTGSISGETAAARVRRRLSPGRRKRKVYRITPHGEALLSELLSADEGADDHRAFALRVAFCRHLDAEARLALFERRRTWLAGKLSTKKNSERRIDRYVRSLIEHDSEAIRRDLEWVDRLIAAEVAGEREMTS
jgi:DNA-binding PadR family transcriptional regulator